MRGARAKALRRQALQHPAWFNSGWNGKTFIHGGAMRMYRDLKRAHRLSGICRVELHYQKMRVKKELD